MKPFKSEPLWYDTYESTVVVYIGETFKSICTEFNLPWELDDDQAVQGYVHVVDGIINIMLRTDSSRKVILHECVHAIDRMYSFMRAQLDPNNDEIYARDISCLQDVVLDMHYEYWAKRSVITD